MIAHNSDIAALAICAARARIKTLLREYGDPNQLNLEAMPTLRPRMLPNPLPRRQCGSPFAA
jgi:hypothetical protein